MLIGYVVHSQLQQTRGVASSSKYTTLPPNHLGQPPEAKPVVAADAPQVVAPGSKGGLVVAPGSKSFSPVIQPPPRSTDSSVPKTRTPAVIAPGSKSAPVFPLQTPQASTASTLKQQRQSATGTNAAVRTR